MGGSTTSLNAVIYAGIDYHKKFSVVSLGDQHGNLIEQRKLENNSAVIAEYFRQYPAVVCAVESCRGYEWLVDLLRSIGVEVRICNPLQAKLIVQTRNKNDKVDSRKLMELLAIGFLPTCYLPTREERQLRERLRWRNSLVASTTRLKLQITISLDKENKGLIRKGLFTKKGRTFIRELDLQPERKQRVHQQLQILEYLELQVANENRWVEEQALNSPQCSLLMTIPGVGPLTALMFYAELGDITRFKRAPQVAKFLGLTPSLDASADKRSLGPITKEGSVIMRWILVQAAWQAVRSDLVFRTRFYCISRRAGRQKAIVAIARMLAEICFCVLRDKKPFDRNRFGKQTA